jgi:hypothetical protein
MKILLVPLLAGLVNCFFSWFLLIRILYVIHIFTIRVTCPVHFSRHFSAVVLSASRFRWWRVNLLRNYIVTRYRATWTDIHALSGIWTHNPSVCLAIHWPWQRKTTISLPVYKTRRWWPVCVFHYPKIDGFRLNLAWYGYIKSYRPGLIFIPVGRLLYMKRKWKFIHIHRNNSS